MESSQTELQEFERFLRQQMESIYPRPDADAQRIKSLCRRPTKPAQQMAIRTILEAKPIQRTNENVVNAEDQRVLVRYTNKWPNGVHGVITSKFKRDISSTQSKDNTFWGTGTLIGPNIVLTAGHNLYDYGNKVYADLKSMQFLPGMDGQLLPFGFSEVEKYFVSPNFIREKKEDYGVLILKKPVGEMTGYFGLACLESEEINLKRINVTGYPFDKVKSKPNTYEMWGMEGQVSRIDQDEGLIHYVIDTMPGQSGGGVWYQEGEDYYVCGVHVAGGTSVNSATLLTKAIYEQIYVWAQESSFKELTLKLGDSKKLSFYHQTGGEECVSLLMKYNLSGLTDLDFAEMMIGDGGAKILAQKTSWADLSRLVFLINNIGADGAKALARNTSWTKLSELVLSKNEIGTEGAKALAENTSWNNLSILDLSDGCIGTEGAKAIAKNNIWTNLRQLNLRSNRIGGEGVKALAENTYWTNLSQLNLSGNSIDEEGVKALAENTYWTNLSQLSLNCTSIDAKGAKELSKNTSWRSLSKLDLSNNPFLDEGAKALAENKSWINLSELRLVANWIRAKGIKALAQNTSWINLSQLNLKFNLLGAEGAKELSKNTSWRNLSKLDLSACHIEDEGAQALAQNASWVNLLELKVTTNRIKDEGHKLLRQNKTWKYVEILTDAKYMN